MVRSAQMQKARSRRATNRYGWPCPALGLAWAFLTTRMGDVDRVEAVEAALLAAAG